MHRTERRGRHVSELARVLLQNPDDEIVEICLDCDMATKDLFYFLTELACSCLSHKAPLRKNAVTWELDVSRVSWSDVHHVRDKLRSAGIVLHIVETFDVPDDVDAHALERTNRSKLRDQCNRLPIDHYSHVMRVRNSCYRVWFEITRPSSARARCRR